MANMISCLGMAYRPDASEREVPLTREQVQEMHRKLMRLAPSQVYQAYVDAYERCRMDRDVLPHASAVQELVVAWKVLRKWRRRRPPGRG